MDTFCGNQRKKQARKKLPVNLYPSKETHDHPSLTEEGVSQSFFYMWRCVVALAHADGVVRKEERDYLNDVFRNMPLTKEQYQTLLHDLEIPENINDFYKYIEEPEDRAQLVYFARILAFKDGEFHPTEQVLIEKLNIKATENIDMKRVSDDVQAYIANKMGEHGKDLENKTSGSLFETFTHWLGRD